MQTLPYIGVNYIESESYPKRWDNYIGCGLDPCLLTNADVENQECGQDTMAGKSMLSFMKYLKYADCTVHRGKLY